MFKRCSLNWCKFWNYRLGIIQNLIKKYKIYHEFLYISNIFNKFKTILNKNKTRPSKLNFACFLKENSKFSCSKSILVMYPEVLEFTSLNVNKYGILYEGKINLSVGSVKWIRLKSQNALSSSSDTSDLKQKILYDGGRGREPISYENRTRSIFMSSFVDFQ